MLRWNQTLRELVARYNLPPAPRSDGSYVFPDAENPFADPEFPFSNPPYAARAYSYVSVAQFEALKAAWAYMYQYRRPSPYRVDSGISSLMPASSTANRRPSGYRLVSTTRASSAPACATMARPGSSTTASPQRRRAGKTASA